MSFGIWIIPPLGAAGAAIASIIAEGAQLGILFGVFFNTHNHLKYLTRKATYAGVSLMENAKLQFVLGGSGHAAGVINPPAKKKYGYWVNQKLTLSADEWQEGAEEHKGSWWIHWHEWLSDLDGTKVAARLVGSEEYPALCDAPVLRII